MDFVHQTVLLTEAVTLMAPAPGKLIVDGTLGGGGHSEALLARGASVLGVDRDPRALSAARGRLARFPHFRAVQGNYAQLDALLAAEGTSAVDGILLDLGVSSPQFDEGARGFSFQKDGPLDMRMGDDGLTAAELIASSEQEEIAHVLKEFGEEPFARAIARVLKATLPGTTLEAAEAVKRAVPRKAWPTRTHVATRTFQALRIWVNEELTGLDRFLATFAPLLKAGGRVGIISFHSLEDRRVKEAFRALEGECTCPPGLPVCVCGVQGTFSRVTKKAVQPSGAEQELNPRARSARLRVVEKLQ